MANLIFLLPREEMAKNVRKVISSLGLNDIKIKVIDTSNAVFEAHEAYKNGVDVIIARGVQANLIKQKTDYTVIEIATTGQEMGLLVIKAKKILKKKKPIIAIVGVKNMFCDMQHFDVLYNVILRTYYVDNIEDITMSVEKAVSEGASFIIGGDIATRHAQELNMPCLFVDTFGEEAIKSVLSIAYKVGWALDLEKKHSAQLKTLLDYSFNGIIKINKHGSIEALNSIAEDMLDIEAANVLNKPIIEVVIQFSKDSLDEALKNGKEYFSTYTKINNKAFAVSVAPILIENVTIDGAIISFNEIETIIELETKIRSEIYYRNYKVNYRFDFGFDFIEEKSVNIIKQIKKAKLYAQTIASVLISGPEGTERDIIAQCIHSESSLKNGSYILFNCGAYGADAQYNILFEGEAGEANDKSNLLYLSHGGTLVFENIEYLSKQCQIYLVQILRDRAILQKSSNRMMPLHFRIIAITGESLSSLVRDGDFSYELFYLLNTLSIVIPPLSGRESDILNWTEHYIKTYCKQYKRFISITNDAKDVLCKYSWDGNLTQLKSFCERIAISSPRRTVNEAFVKELLVEAYPVLKRNKADNKIIEYSSLEAAEIAALLDEHRGNRTKVAGILGISTTTLWRKIKKLGIESKYEQ